jgi:hypothetical protein
MSSYNRENRSSNEKYFEVEVLGPQPETLTLIKNILENETVGAPNPSLPVKAIRFERRRN